MSADLFVVKANDQTLSIVIWSIFAGIVIGILLSVYHKYVLGSFVRRLLDSGASSEWTAVTMDEAGLGKSRILRLLTRRAILGSGSYAKIVRSPELPYPAPPPKKGQKTPPRKIDSSTRFYIPDDMQNRAIMTYTGGARTIIWALVSIAVLLGIALLSFYIVPALSEMFANIFR
ncbi:MAG: hypothetical protein GX897_05165 [Clostridiales bacterium]|nr:hypothetical protein [Clostridiales bacterium]